MRDGRSACRCKGHIEGGWKRQGSSTNVLDAKTTSDYSKICVDDRGARRDDGSMRGVDGGSP